METVEEQCEDVPCDMRPYVDSEGNAYDFAFGLNWSGVIRDERVRRYGKKSCYSQKTAILLYRARFFSALQMETD